MPQFFISSENIHNNRIIITKQTDIRHIVNVLRLNIGDKLTVVEPDHLVYDVEISAINQNQIETTIINKYEPLRGLNINITLVQSILKSQKQDITIQKAAELGVKVIQPIISRNTVVKIESEKDRIQKVQRWQKIVYESAKQCKRTDIPQINQIISISELIELNNFDVKLVCAEYGAKATIKEVLQKFGKMGNKKPDIMLIIGPEGGWDRKELDLFESKGIIPVSLGNLILRAETASITAISDIIYEYEL